MARFNINSSFVSTTQKRPTSSSVIFISPIGKVILPYRGASRFLDIKDLPFKELKAKWFYVAPLSGSSVNNFSKLIDFAKKNNIKVAINPSKYQLAEPGFKKNLKDVDILLLNREEASFLTKITFKQEKRVFLALNKLTKGICIMTKNNKGALASDGKAIYSVPILPVKVVDSTGAGDSFGAGFVSEIIRGKDIVQALQFATANAAANLTEIGGKDGVLKSGAKWKKVKVKKVKF